MKYSSKHSLLNNNCRYLDDILTVSNPISLHFVKQIHLKDFTLNKNWAFLYLVRKVNLTHEFTTKETIFYLYRQLSFFLDVSIIHGVSIFRLVRFARICFKVYDFNEWYHFHKLLKTFTKDYYRYKYLISTVLHLIKKDNSHFTFLWWRY